MSEKETHQLIGGTFLSDPRIYLEETRKTNGDERGSMICDLCKAEGRKEPIFSIIFHHTNTWPQERDTTGSYQEKATNPELHFWQGRRNPDPLLN